MGFPRAFILPSQGGATQVAGRRGYCVFGNAKNENTKTSFLSVLPTAASFDCALA